jgi:hypothetical protein
MKNKKIIPECLRLFFCEDEPPKDVPKGRIYVYAGPKNSRDLSLFQWDSKRKHGENVVKGLAEELKEYHVFVDICELILHICSHSPRSFGLKPKNEREIRSYARAIGLKVPDRKEPLPKKVAQKQPAKKEEPLPPAKKQDDKIDFFRGKAKAVVEINLEQSMEIKTPSGSKSLVLLPGKLKLALIDSPHQHEKGMIFHLALDDHLPVVYSKPVTSWQQTLGYNPLSS